MKQYGIVMLLAATVFGFLWLTNWLWFTFIVLAVVYGVATVTVAIGMTYNWGYSYGMRKLNRKVTK